MNELVCFLTFVFNTARWIKINIGILFFRQYLEHFMDHMPIESERKANKLLYVCEKRNMGEQGMKFKVISQINAEGLPVCGELVSLKIDLLVGLVV